MIRSASLNACRRASWKCIGSPGGSVPRPAPFMKAGMFRVRTNSMAASVARHVQTWLPSSTQGFSDAGDEVGELLDRRPGRRPTSWTRGRRRRGGSGPARAAPWRRARRAGSPGTTGPGAPWKHSRNAIETMSATRAVCGTVAANLRDRRHHVDVREVLQRPHLVLAERALAADEQHRALRAERVGHAGDRVAGAGACGHDGAAGRAGDAGVAVGRVRGDLLVPHVDDGDALVHAAVVDVDDVAAAERVDRVHALGLQRLRHEVAAGDRLSGGRWISDTVSSGASGDRLRHGKHLLVVAAYGARRPVHTAYGMAVLVLLGSPVVQGKLDSS